MRTQLVQGLANDRQLALNGTFGFQSAKYAFYISISAVNEPMAFTASNTPNQFWRLAPS